MYALDGNAYYARPGPRLLQGCGIIARLLHGDVVGDAIGEDIAPRDSWNVIAEPPPPPPPPATASPAERQEEKLKCSGGVDNGGAPVASVAPDVTAPAGIKA